MSVFACFAVTLQSTGCPLRTRLCSTGRSTQQQIQSIRRRPFPSSRYHVDSKNLPSREESVDYGGFVPKVAYQLAQIPGLFRAQKCGARIVWRVGVTSAASILYAYCVNMSD